MINYLLIGNGRMARHFQHYLSLLGLNFYTWHRNEPLSKLYSLLPQISHILLLISDYAIEGFINQYLHCLSKPIFIHFSGHLVSKKAYGAHPLMTFSRNLYSLQQYQTIPFIVGDDAPEFNSLLPGLPNPHFCLSAHLKAKYHALCVLSGNFSTLLWQKFFQDFENEFNFPKEIGHPYLQQCMHNLLEHPQTALTGPLSRGDEQTIQNNINALKDDPFQEVYKSFVACYKKLNSLS